MNFIRRNDNQTVMLLCTSILFLLIGFFHNCDSKALTAGKAPRLKGFPPNLQPPCSLPSNKEAYGEWRCCGSSPYNPSNQTCCWDSVLHNYPSADSECCRDAVYHRSDRKNPCMEKCGDVFYNIETQKCWDDKVLNISETNRNSPSPAAPSTRRRGRVTPPRRVPGHVAPPPKREQKEETPKPCGSEWYKPSTQTCCEHVVHDIPSADSECCFENAFRKTDRASNRCIGKCGRKEEDYNTETQICCGGNVFNRTTSKTSGNEICCGDSPMNRRLQTCCNGMRVDRGKMSCCAETMPYHTGLFECDEKSQRVRPKTEEWKVQNLPGKICSKKLDTWGEAWSLLNLTNMVQLDGRVERCDIHFKRNSIVIPLSPVRTIQGGTSVSKCIKNMRLKLVIKLPLDQTCLGLKKMKRYLRDKTLSIFFPTNAKMFKCRPNRFKTRLTLRIGDPVLILLSRRMDTALMKSSFS